MKFLLWSLWLLLVTVTFAVCVLAAFMWRDTTLDPVMKWGVVGGLVWMAADLFSVIRTPPWRNPRE